MTKHKDVLDVSHDEDGREYELVGSTPMPSVFAFVYSHSVSRSSCMDERF